MIKIILNILLIIIVNIELVGQDSTIMKIEDYLDISYNIKYCNSNEVVLKIKKKNISKQAIRTTGVIRSKRFTPKQPENYIFNGILDFDKHVKVFSDEGWIFDSPMFIIELEPNEKYKIKYVFKSDKPITLNGFKEKVILIGNKNKIITKEIIIK